MKKYIDIMSQENPMVKLILNEIGGLLNSDNGTEEKELIIDLKKKTSELVRDYDLKRITTDVYEIKRKKSTVNKKEDLYIKSITLNDSMGQVKRLFSKKNPEGYKKYLDNLISSKKTEIENITIVNKKVGYEVEYLFKNNSLSFFYEDTREESIGNRGRKYSEIDLRNGMRVIFNENSKPKKDNLINVIFDNKELAANPEIVIDIVDSILLKKEMNSNIEETVLISTDIDLKNFINDPIKINILDVGTNNIKNTNKKRFSI